MVSFNPRTKERMVLAGEYDGKPFNSPNDLWIDPKGGISARTSLYSLQMTVRGHKLAFETAAR